MSIILITQLRKKEYWDVLRMFDRLALFMIPHLNKRQQAPFERHKCNLIDKILQL